MGLNVGPDIRFETRGRLALVTLDRGAALNALTHAMVRAIAGALDAWESDECIAHVAIRSADPRAFSAGGDIRDLYEKGLAWKAGLGPSPLDFFRDEYLLNHRIRTYPKPFVALIDGLAMGGGLGVSINGRFRVAGEGMRFAMPEVGIGFFPDVGATYFLPRLPGETGTWLALTGSRIGRDDCLWSGLATHAVGTARHDSLLAALAAADDAQEVLADFDEAPASAAPLQANLLAIDALFAGEDAAAIADRLAREAGGSALATASREAIGRASPTSLVLALRQMRLGARLSFADAMRTEYRIVSRVLAGHDFYEGVRAQIVDKDRQPAWRPDRLEAVPDQAVDDYFAPLAEELDLCPAATAR